MHWTGSANHLTSKTSYAVREQSVPLVPRPYAQTKTRSASSFRFVHSASDKSLLALASSGGKTLALNAGCVCKDSLARRFGNVLRCSLYRPMSVVNSQNRLSMSTHAHHTTIIVCTHFDHSSARLPRRLLTIPSLPRQYISSDSADRRSIRWLIIVEADMGFGERRSVSGCKGLRSSKHLRVRDRDETAIFIRFELDLNHRGRGLTAPIMERRYRYVRSEYWTHFLNQRCVQVERVAIIPRDGATRSAESKLTRTLSRPLLVSIRSAHTAVGIGARFPTESFLS